MTKYELYQILDENGFEPSEENLDLLTEGLEAGYLTIGEDNVIYEALFDRITRKAERDGHVLAKAALGKKVDPKRLQLAKDRIDKRVANGNAGYAERAAASFKNKSDKFARGMAAQRSLKDNEAALKNDVENTKNYGGDASKNTIASYQPKPEVVKEDYELYQLLDKNGFEPTNENLEILKENLYNGDTIILSLAPLALTESMGEIDIYAQILAENGFAVTRNNINVLAEAIENGHVLLEKKDAGDKETGGADLTDKESKDKKGERILTDTGKKVLKTAAIIAGTTILGGAAAGAAADGLGRLNAEKAAEKASDEAVKSTEASAAADKAYSNPTPAEGEKLGAKEDFEAKDAAAKENPTDENLNARETAKADLDDAEKAKNDAKTKADDDAARAKYKGFEDTKRSTRVAHGVVGTVGGAAAGAGAGVAIAKKALKPKEAKAGGKDDKGDKAPKK